MLAFVSAPLFATGGIGTTRWRTGHHRTAVHHDPVLRGSLALAVGRLVEPDLRGRQAEDGLRYARPCRLDDRTASNAANQNHFVDVSCSHFRFSSFKTMGVPAPAFVAQARLRLAADAGRRVHDLMVERAVGVGALHAGLRTKITLLTSPAAISDSPHSKRWVCPRQLSLPKLGCGSPLTRDGAFMI